MVRVPEAQSTTTERGEAKVHILDFKSTWLEVKKPCTTVAALGEVEQRIYNIKKYHHPRVCPKQLCALAHLGCARAVGTSY